MFNRRTYLLVLCAVSLFSYADNHSNEDGLALLKILERMQSFLAEFEQSVIDSRGVELENLKGEISFRKPNLFKWNVQSPYEQLTIFKEEYIYIYEPELAQLTIQNLDNQGGPNLALLLTSGDNLLFNDFVIREEYFSMFKRRFVLTPKIDEVLFTSLVMDFLGDELTEISILDHQGQATRIVFSNVKMNSVLESGNFDLEVPEGTDIIGDVTERDPAEQ